MNAFNPFKPKAPPYSSMIVEVEGEIEWLTLNRPDSANALHPEMMLELQDYFSGLRYRQDVRVVIVKANGRHFCAGLDISPEHQIDLDSPAEGIRIQNRVSEIVKLMRSCPQPIIALVNGAACGGGFSIALAADVRFCTPDAKMNTAFTQIGLSGCDVGSSYFLTRMLGASIASELMLTGRFIKADEASHYGLVSEVVNKEHIEESGRRVANEMLNVAPLALRLTKEGINVNIDASGLSAAIAIEDRQQILCSQSRDCQEALQAFREKRSPDYSDR